MERRILLAFLLSFLVLSIWSRLFPPPQTRGTEPRRPQLSDNKGDTTHKEIAETHTSSLPEKTDLPQKKIKEELFSIENEKILTMLMPSICHETHACSVPNIAKKANIASIQIVKAFLEVNVIH